MKGKMMLKVYKEVEIEIPNELAEYVIGAYYENGEYNTEMEKKVNEFVRGFENNETIVANIEIENENGLNYFLYE